MYDRPDTIKSILKAWQIENEPNKLSSLRWLIDEAKKLRHVKGLMGATGITTEDIIKNKQSGKFITRGNMRKEFIGSMLLYTYDPKWKEELPYYDIYPLIFPFELKEDGWLGINLHYLPPKLRQALLENLMQAFDDKKNRINITYKFLQATGTAYAPCIKRYLAGHVRSRLLIIEPEDWKKTIALPFAQFKKASQTQVWKESNTKIKSMDSGRKRRK